MQYVSDILSPNLYCHFINAKNWIRRKKHRIHPSDEPGIYRVTDGQETLYICRRIRHNRSKRGVAVGIEALARQYNLHHIPVSPGDLLIDCGANIGELGVWARLHDLNYIAIEPETLESRCVDLNAFAGEAKTFRMALWFEETVLSFFSKPTTADSSVIEMNDFDNVRQVQAKRLDALITDLPANAKTILKVEAEGAEPEVLAGAKELLKNIDYIAIDCGFERGKNKDHTFSETNTILVDNGFRVEQANFKRMTMVYRNIAKTSVKSHPAPTA